MAAKAPILPNQQIVKELTLCDSMGIIHKNRTDLNAVKLDLLNYTNPRNLEGSVFEAILDADVFIGVSKADLLDRNDIRTMAKDPFILALANPIPEIFPNKAFGLGRSNVDFGCQLYSYPTALANAKGF